MEIKTIVSFLIIKSGNNLSKLGAPANAKSYDRQHSHHKARMFFMVLHFTWTSIKWTVHTGQGMDRWHIILFDWSDPTHLKEKKKFSLPCTQGVQSQSWAAVVCHPLPSGRISSHPPPSCLLFLLLLPSSLLLFPPPSSTTHPLLLPLWDTNTCPLFLAWLRFSRAPLSSKQGSDERLVRYLMYGMSVH